MYVEVEILKPDAARQEGEQLELWVSWGQLNLRDALDIKFKFLKTIADLGIANQIATSTAAVQDWNECRILRSTPPSTLDLSTPFVDAGMTLAWKTSVQGEKQMHEETEAASLQDSLEPDPANRKQAMNQHRFKDFWLEAEHTEWTGLWKQGCFKKWRRSDLLPNDRVFSSRYHYKIKHAMVTGKITKFKVRLVVQGHCMKEGKDYNDSFALVQATTIVRIMMALAAAEDLELHTIDLTQVFIQADKLDEGVNGRVFKYPPPGCEEYKEGEVNEVLQPLYCIPSSARALHVTLAKWFAEEGFKTVGFEDSVWSRPGGGKYASRIIVSAHIDDCLITCKDTKTLKLFKAEFLKQFD